MEFFVNGVNSAAGTNNKTSIHQKRPESYVVKNGETIYKIAQKYEMTVKQFCNWTGLKQNDNLKAGQRIPLQRAKISHGKGLLALVNKYDMDKESFCKLNGIQLKDFNNYVVNSNEMFYVFKGLKTASSTASKQSSAANKSTPAADKNKTKPEATKQSNAVHKKKINGVKEKSIVNSETISTIQYKRTGKNPDEIKVGMLEKYPPVPIDENRKIKAEIVTFKPKQPNTGELKGKTIMVNAGHGWRADGNFDHGKDAKDVNGKEINEWRKNRDFAAELIKELTAKGATVVFSAGSATLAINSTRAKNSYDAVISLHCNSGPSAKNGYEAYYNDNDVKGKGGTLTKIMAKKLGAVQKSDKTTRFQKLGILRDGKYSPSVLLEMGYMTNSKDKLNIDSIADRKQRMKLVADGLVEFFNSQKTKVKVPAKTNDKAKIKKKG